MMLYHCLKKEHIIHKNTKERWISKKHSCAEMQIKKDSIQFEQNMCYQSEEDCAEVPFCVPILSAVHG